MNSANLKMMNSGKKIKEEEQSINDATSS